MLRSYFKGVGYQITFIKFCSCLIISCYFFNSQSQSVSFALKTSPNVNFTFNSVEDYQTGLLIANISTLNIEATGTQWDLYVGATTMVSGFWDIVSTYSTWGNDPTVNMVQLQFRNTNNTSQVL